MTWPNVTINQLNRHQGTINEVERTLLFVGPVAAGSDNAGDLLALNAQSDIDTELADAAEALRENVRAAQLNAGQNWQAYALLLEEDSKPGDWLAAIEDVQDMISVEGVVAMTAFNDAGAGRTIIEAAQALRARLTATLGRWMWFILTAAGPTDIQAEPDNESGLTWPDYLAFLANLEKDIAAPGVQLVPALWGNEAGVLAGRLCDRAVTVADSPARVETGPLLGLGIGTSDLPVDGAGLELTLAHLRAMHDLRCSVPMWYPDFEGKYWSDGLTLEAKGGDYAVIEDVRVVDKASRRVRLQAISKIANRNLNSTPSSIAAHEAYFGRVLREMARSVQINGVTFPGEVKSPREGDVTIAWLTEVKVAIYLVVRPYESGKEIAVSIMLDKTLEKGAEQ
ncbi:DUF2586 domain-containing protein [Serratia marcescens]